MLTPAPKPTLLCLRRVINFNSVDKQKKPPRSTPLSSFLFFEMLFSTVLTRGVRLPLSGSI